MTASQFILVYNGEQSALEHRVEFRDPLAAVEAYRRAERTYSERPEMHVVMLSGQSSETLAATHGTYFKDPFFFIGELGASADGEGEEPAEHPPSERRRAGASEAGP